MISLLAMPRNESHPWTTSLASAVRTRTAHSTVSATPATSRSATATANSSRPGCSSARRVSLASPTAGARRRSIRACPERRRSPSSSTWSKATGSVRPNGSPGSTVTPSCGWRGWPADTPGASTTSGWLFPPRAREVQLDEMWSFVAKKQAHRDPADPADDHKGGRWDHVAYDAEHRPALDVVPGARSIENTEGATRETYDRT